jgi:tetraacyldisaccharide 4'-kinase
MLEGRRGGIAGRVFRIPLVPVSILYGLAGKSRVSAYRRGWLKSKAASVPVISIGNLTAGGTGKTPFVIALCRLLAERGETPAILTRGYGAASPEDADEIRLFRQRLPEVKISASPDRVASAKQAVAEGATILVLDDGFQHLRLRRDLDIVLLDATCPLGGGWPLPAGLLREFPSALERADLICLTRCDQAHDLTQTRDWLRQTFPDKPVLLTEHQPVFLKNLQGEKLDMDRLKEKPVVAVAGIGSPSAFAATLKQLGAEIRAELFFADHHAYSAADVRKIIQTAASHSAAIVTTEKDAVKLALLADATAGKILALGVELCLREGEEVLREKLATLSQLSGRA